MIVVGNFLKVTAYVFSSDACAVEHSFCWCFVNDITESIVNGNLVAIFLYLCIENIVNAYLIDIVVFIKIHELLYCRLNLVGVEKFINHLSRNKLLWLAKGNHVVGIFVEVGS